MTKPAHGPNMRWPGFLLAALVAALVILFGAGTASAATATAAQTRVGAHTLMAPFVVGPQSGIGAGQRLGNDPPAYDSALATGVAAEGGAAAGDVLATPEVASSKLQNIVNDLYKGTTNPGRVGTGTTADAVRFELRTGEQIFGRSHVQKAGDYARGLENWLKSNPDAPYQDRLVARSLADDLLNSLGRG